MPYQDFRQFLDVLRQARRRQSADRILGKDTVSFSAQPFHRFGKHLAKHRRLGTVPKAALVIGVDPILAYTCQVQVPDDQAHFGAGLCRRVVLLRDSHAAAPRG